MAPIGPLGPVADPQGEDRGPPVFQGVGPRAGDGHRGKGGGGLLTEGEDEPVVIPPGGEALGQGQGRTGVSALRQGQDLVQMDSGDLIAVQLPQQQLHRPDGHRPGQAGQGGGGEGAGPGASLRQGGCGSGLGVEPVPVGPEVDQVGGQGGGQAGVDGLEHREDLPADAVPGVGCLGIGAVLHPGHPGAGQVSVDV